MPLNSLAEVVQACSPDSVERSVCCFHETQPAWGICQRCGRDLCRKCLSPYDLSGLCPRCRGSVFHRLARLGSALANPLAALTGGIVLLSLIYLALGRDRALAGSGRSAADDKEAVSCRNWVFLGKAARLKLYADYCAGNRRSNAARSYRRARLALDEVLRGTEREFDSSPVKAAKESDKLLKERFARLLIAAAACDRGANRTSAAIELLKKAEAIDPQSDAGGLTRYRMAQIYEEDLKKPDQAIAMYEAAQGGATAGRDVLGEIVDSLSKPPDERGSLNVIRRLSGGYEPAEAQFRIISCCKKLGRTQNALKAYEILVEKYPYSEWAEQAAKSSDFASRRRKVAKEEEPDAGHREAEDMKVIRLDE